MKKRLTFLLLGPLIVCAVGSMQAQPTRTDAVWARTVASGSIKVDGILNEAAWAAAESVQIVYGQAGPIPGSGWHAEGGKEPAVDPTKATIKFLAQGDSLFVGVIVKDSSVGGGLFNQFDGFLMNIRRKEQTKRPVDHYEYFYAWVTESWGCGTAASLPGAFPCFMGAAGGARTDGDSLSKTSWYGATTVQGTVNNDTLKDVGYSTELRFNVATRGYDIKSTAGDIVMFNISVYDADWRWPIDSSKYHGNRVWLQGPWGNANSFGHMRVWAKPSVTTTSGTAPALTGPDLAVPNATNHTAPVIDGVLTEQVWKTAPSLQIKYGDATIRNAYLNTGPYRSGQFQPTVNGVIASVTEPSTATVKYFFKDDSLYLGFDVNDQVVQYRPEADRYDGFRVTINDRLIKDAGDNNLITHRIRFFVDSLGNPGLDEDSPALRDSGAVRVGLALKAGTTVDTLGTSADAGYTAELRINLRKLGYAAGRGDGVAFLGVTYYDGDSFTPATNSYGTRTWWFREDRGGDGPAWVYMDPALIVTDVEAISDLPLSYALLGNYPNPFNPATTIKYVLREESNVTLEVYNVLGQVVEMQLIGTQQAGERQTTFAGNRLNSGVYFYRLRMNEPGSNSEKASFVGKMMLLK